MTGGCIFVLPKDRSIFRRGMKTTLRKTSKSEGPARLKEVSFGQKECFVFRLYIQE